MSEQASGDTRERATPVNIGVRRAVDYANKIMSDVPAEQPGSEAMWMMHFYSRFLPEWGEPDPRLIDTIDFFAAKAFEEQEKAGFPDELADAV